MLIASFIRGAIFVESKILGSLRLRDPTTYHATILTRYTVADNHSWRYNALRCLLLR